MNIINSCRYVAIVIAQHQGLLILLTFGNMDKTSITGVSNLVTLSLYL